MTEHRSAIDIAAAPHIVFDYLVTDSGITAWMGDWARVDATPGGQFAVNIAGFGARGTFLEVDPPRRVMVSWGFEGNDTLPPGASTVSFELSPTPDGTRLEVIHTDLPADDVPGHVDGWSHFLPRLAAVAAGATLLTDPWKPAP